MTKEAGQQGIVIEIYVLKALGQVLRGDSRAALDNLGNALALAEPEGYVRIFVDEGESLVALLTHIASSKHPQRTYAEQLLTALKGKPGYSRTVDRGRRARLGATYLEPLSERELEVLRLLADGLESGEIAERLIIAVETARKHIKNIYSKLDVHSRWEAVKRAEELDLL
jgi:LuxR family maltose regulon positive regulatory protein